MARLGRVSATTQRSPANCSDGHPRTLEVQGCARGRPGRQCREYGDPVVEVVKPKILNPDDATQRGEVRRFLAALAVGTAAAGAAQLIGAVILDNSRWWATAILLGAGAIWFAAFPRRLLDHRPVGTVVAEVAVVVAALMIGVAVLEPSAAMVAATAILIPMVFAMPYVERRPLRWLTVFAWVGAVAASAARFLPDEGGVSGTARQVAQMMTLAVVLGIVFSSLYQMSGRMKASSREFRRLFQMSVELAETAEPAVLGALIARHLTEATDFDDCVIYAIDPEGGSLTTFGSYPVERAIETGPQSLERRPVLGRILHDRMHLVIDVVDVIDESGELIEQDRLRRLGRQTMILLPLVAQSDPVGIVELTAGWGRLVDERTIALVRTLAFEAAMSIENGRLYREVQYRSLHDPLTDLANRNLFNDRVTHAFMRLTRQQGANVAMLFIDIDDFKRVNDTLGHARGDALLALLARRLREVVRPGDTVARVGGDEFAVLLEEVGSVEDARLVAQRVIDAIAIPIEIDGLPISAALSIGISLRSVADATADELLREADAAMYEAKRTGKGRAVIFTSEIGSRSAGIGLPDPEGQERG